MTRDDRSRAAWQGDFDQEIAGAPLSLVVTCAQRRLLVVTREHPARVLSTGRPSNTWRLLRIDAQGLYAVGWEHMRDRESLHLGCHRHPGGHNVDISRLVTERQRATREGERHGVSRCPWSPPPAEV